MVAASREESRDLPAPEPRSFGYTEEAGVATLTLRRPDRLNALTFEVYGELRDTFRALARRERSVRAVVLTGEGRGFCSGGDVHEIIGELVRYEPRELLEFTRLTCDVVRAMRACPQPIVAAVNGIAAGAGAVLALASDLRLCAESATFAFLFVRVGLAGADMGTAYLLPRVVGLGRAAELLYLGDKINAAEAHRIGLCNRMVPDGELADAAQALARRVAEGPSLALALTKRLMEEELSMTLEQALAAEERGQAFLMTTRDFREAHQSFVERRPARFEGR
jgi:enoyl-CoA hydratase/carnithine racemase